MPENVDQKKIRENQSKNYFDATADAWKSRVDVSDYVIEQLNSGLDIGDLERKWEGLKKIAKEDSKTKKNKELTKDYEYTFPGYISGEGSSYSVYQKIRSNIENNLKDFYKNEAQQDRSN
jgi:hypothetical protein